MKYPTNKVGILLNSLKKTVLDNIFILVQQEIFKQKIPLESKVVGRLLSCVFIIKVL